MKAEIQYTKNYDIFKFYDSNRKIYNDHVNKLANDPTFANDFYTSPMVSVSKIKLNGLKIF